MRKPGVSKLRVTNSRIAAFPSIAGVPGGNTEASSVQNERTRSRSRAAAACDHSASSRRISAFASPMSILLHHEDLVRPPHRRRRQLRIRVLGILALEVGFDHPTG